LKTHIIAVVFAAALMIGIGGAAFAGPQSAATADEKASGHRGDSARGLDALVEEAMAHSPLIEAARNHWEAQTRAPVQAGTLPDPQITFQHFSVGDPGPGSGLGNSDFAYLGFGASQDVPFPGKLGLQAAIAQRDAEYARQQYETARREAAEKVRELYFELCYHDKIDALLHQIHDELGRIAEIAETRYRVGQGQQQDVIKAQLQLTAILKELAMHHQDGDQVQLELKAVLGRDADSPDVETGELTPSTIRLSGPELRKLVDARSPELGMQHAMEERGRSGLELARKGYQPDFSVGYMFQHTGQRFRDYYLLTLGAKVPLYFWRKQTPAIEQAELELQAARAQVRARSLDMTAAVDRQVIAFQTAERVLTIYREGLIPQARNSLEAALAAYRVSKVDFQTLLSAVIDLLNVNQEYYREVADHEIALAKIEQVVGDLK
jgi:outer membrane protein TolC